MPQTQTMFRSRDGSRWLNRAHNALDLRRIALHRLLPGKLRMEVEQIAQQEHHEQAVRYLMTGLLSSGLRSPGDLAL